jgi:Spy/CpxP family protein refolding chaperone
MRFRSVSLIAILAITARFAIGQTFEREIKTAVFSHGFERAVAVQNPGAIEPIVQGLRLNNAQAANFRSLIDVRAKEIETLSAEIQEKRLALHRALEQSSPNAMEVGTLTVSVQELEARWTAIDERFQNAFSNMLTPDQRSTFEGIKAAAKQIEAFHMTGLIGPSKVTHDFVIGTGGSKGVFMKFVEAAEIK